MLLVLPCSRKGSVRVSSYFFKFFAHQRFVPSHIEVRSCLLWGVFCLGSFGAGGSV